MKLMYTRHFNTAYTMNVDSCVYYALTHANKTVVLNDDDLDEKHEM